MQCGYKMNFFLFGEVAMEFKVIIWYSLKLEQNRLRIVIRCWDSILQFSRRQP